MFSSVPKCVFHSDFYYDPKTATDIEPTPCCDIFIFHDQSGMGSSVRVFIALNKYSVSTSSRISNVLTENKYLRTAPTLTSHGVSWRKENLESCLWEAMLTPRSWI